MGVVTAILLNAIAITFSPLTIQSKVLLGCSVNMQESSRRSFLRKSVTEFYSNPTNLVQSLILLQECYKFSKNNISQSYFYTYKLRCGEGNGTPLQYSCLENPMDGGAWQAAVHGVAKSRTQLNDFTFTFTHWRRKWQPAPVFLPGESQGRWSLMGRRLWGRTESDTTEATQQQQKLRWGTK